MNEARMYLLGTVLGAAKQPPKLRWYRAHGTYNSGTKACSFRLKAMSAQHAANLAPHRWFAGFVFSHITEEPEESK